MDRKFRMARVWSNNELKKYANYFSGDIVNVSAWKDKDKEGGSYKDYFLNANSYSITNYGGTMGDSDGELSYPEYILDLEKILPAELIKKFDVAFNHTTLEHIYEDRIAFKNICDMAKDAVIIVVPWVQQVHIEKGVYDDYRRYTPYAMYKMFEENGYSLVVCNYNNDYDTAVYLFCIAIRNEVKEKYPMFKKIVIDNDYPAGRWIGSKKSIFERIKDKIKNFRH